MGEKVFDGCIIMELSEQLTSLAPSKKLKELGVKQESECYHQWNCVVGKYFLRTKKEVQEAIYPYEHYISAFSVAENDDALPGEDIRINTKEDFRTGFLTITKTNKRWHYGYNSVTDEILICVSLRKQADASAKLRIWLIENKLIDV